MSARLVCDCCDKIIGEDPYYEVADKPEMAFGPDPEQFCSTGCLLSGVMHRLNAESAS